jgi:murein DD-endopeptidase MepM/ murein hydrolase activator NlpD
MTRPPRSLTVVVHRDGATESRSVRFPLWLVRLAAVAAVAFLVLVIVASALYAPVARTAARVPGLAGEVERLREENAQVRELAGQLAAVEASYDQLQEMLGVDLVPNRARVGAVPAVAYPILASAPDAAAHDPTIPTRPTRWPLEEPGIVTRGPVAANGTAEAHSGVDVAVPVGTPIRAAGGGVVVEAGRDDEYGLFVRLRHVGDIESMYGHASRLLVARGDSVTTGQVIALSGSTGRSTAPHLHFELFRAGASIDPRNVIIEES